MELSIIIPFYFGERHITKLLQSITNSVANSSFGGHAIEILIIVDSMSTQTEILQQQLTSFKNENLQLFIFKNDVNKGVAATRNEGIKLARGRHLLFIDQDDTVTENFFTVLTNELLKDTDFILCNGMLEYDSNVKTRIYYSKPALSFKYLVLDDFIRSPGQVIVRKTLIKEIGFPVPEKFHGADDKFCWIWLFYQYPKIRVNYIGKPVYVARIHNDNFSHDQTNLIRSTLDLWQVTLSRFPSLKNNDYVKRNIRLAEFRLGRLRGFEKWRGGMEYLRYKLKANKLIRVLVRSYLRKTKID
jgi:glycosyltransferase involved in cell wall biosynthesis